MTPILKDGKTAIPDEAIDSVKKNFVALKGPLAVGLTTDQLWLSLYADHVSIDSGGQRPCLSKPYPSTDV